MDFVTHLLFESSIWLGVFSFLLFSAVLLLRPHLTGPARAYSLPAVMLLIIALFVIQHLVVTERERIWARLDDFISAIEKRDDAGISDAISDTFQSDGMNRDAFLSYVSRRLRDLNIYDTRVSDREVTLHDDSAELDLSAAATIQIQGGIGDRHVGRWRIAWSREVEIWRITAIQPRMIDLVQFRSLRDLP